MADKKAGARKRVIELLGEIRTMIYTERPGSR
jgi:hypothetical protein